MKETALVIIDSLHTVCYAQWVFLILITNSEILTNHSKVSCLSLLKIGILECKSFNKKNKFFIVIG